MKVTEILLLTINILTCTLGGEQPPKCEAKDVNTFKPNYEDSSWYYHCTGVGTYVSLPCHGGKWFSFAHQECVKKSDWVPPFIPPTPPATVTPPTTISTVSTQSVTNATLPDEATTISVTIATNTIFDENNPPYPTIPTNITDHPTPPTRPPREAPTPVQTTAGTPEPTLPKAPPNVENPDEQEPPYPTRPPNHPTPPTPVPTGAATPAPTTAPVPGQTLPDSPPIA